MRPLVPFSLVCPVNRHGGIRILTSNGSPAVHVYDIFLTYGCQSDVMQQPLMVPDWLPEWRIACTRHSEGAFCIGQANTEGADNQYSKTSFLGAGRFLSISTLRWGESYESSFTRRKSWPWPWLRRKLFFWKLGIGRLWHYFLLLKPAFAIKIIFYSNSRKRVRIAMGET